MFITSETSYFYGVKSKSDVAFDLDHDGKLYFGSIRTNTKACRAIKMQKKTARQFLEAIINKYKKQ